MVSRAKRRDKPQPVENAQHFSRRSSVALAHDGVQRPEDRYEVEVRGEEYLILRERDIHAVASERIEGGSTGLYL